MKQSSRRPFSLALSIKPPAGHDNDETTARQSPRSPSLTRRPLSSVPFYIPHKGQESPLLFHRKSLQPWNDSPPSTPALSGSNFVRDEVQYERVSTTKRTFAEMVSNCTSLPTTVIVSESIYGIANDFTVFKNDMLDVHFIKETQFADVKTSNGEKFEIPLYAPYTFTCDYYSRSLCDIEYKVSELIKLRYLPKVGIIKNAFFLQQSKSRKSSHFMEGEVLVFKGRIKSSTIECFSISQKETKRIHKSSSELIIRANPSQFIFDFTELIFFEFPLQVKIHPIPVRLQTVFGSKTTIESLSMKKSFITSSWSSNDHNDKQTELFEFLPDAPFTFEMVHDLPQAQENLIKKSRMIYENFNPIQVKNVIYNDDKNRHYVQGTLFKLLMNPTPGGLGDDRWKSVVRLCQPNCFYPISADKKEGRAHLNDQHRNGSTYRDDDADSFRQVRFNSSVSIPPMMPTPTLTDVQQPLPPSLSDSTAFHERMRSFSFDLIVDGDEGHDEMTPGSVSSVNDNTRVVTKLIDLSCDQVLLLLEKLGLSQYKEIFAKEKISGDLLKELDEEVLEHELGIKLKLHRIKLLRVIEGRVSVDSILT